MFSGRKKLLGVLGAGLLVAAAIGASGALAQGGGTPVPVPGIAGDDEGTTNAISGDALTKASDAALAHTGGGSVTDTEQGDEESFYEVEVTLPDGTQVDVQLDESFNVVGDKAAETGENAGEGEQDDDNGADAETADDGTADSETPDDAPGGEAATPAN